MGKYSKSNSGAMIVLAWPETTVYKTGAWYDGFMSLLGFCKNGYYKVGHAALVLASAETHTFHYFDFGRYHTPIGTGRVRNEDTDPELKIPFQAKFDLNGEVVNLAELLSYLKKLKSTHGNGKLVSSVIYPFNFTKAFTKAKALQQKGAIPYGPFVLWGTNCSRFVATIAKAGHFSLIKKWQLKIPYVISHSPISNVKICSSHKNYFVQTRESLTQESSLIQKLYNPLKSKTRYSNVTR